MVDFIKVLYKDKSIIEPLICNNEIFKELDVTVEYHTRKLKYPYKTKLDIMDIVISSNTATVKNSIHKLCNSLSGNGNQNYNDFHHSDLCDTIDYLEDKIKGIKSVGLSRLEFGLNIIVPKSAEDIIRYNIIMHQLKGFNHDKEFKGKGKLKEYVHSNYSIKIYDKAKQFGLAENILRFEIKFTKGIEFNKLGVHNLEDLKNKKSLHNLFDYLLKRFDEMTIVDDYSQLIIEEKRTLDAFLSFIHWEKFTRINRNKKSEEKREFNELLIGHNLLTLKAELKTLLQNKFRELINK